MTPSSTSPDYVYQPLESSTSIRIIALEPSLDHEAALMCDLVHADRAEILQGKAGNLHYEPVSYVWGEDPKFTHSLQVGSERIGITESVDEILRILRKPTRTRYLWIDAICLNQQDAVEKSVQVPVMGQIYEEGRKTHIHLDGEQSFLPAFQCLRRLARFESGIVRHSQKEVYVYKSTDTNEFHTADVLRGLQGDAEANRESILDLLRHRWFTRRWVLQEAVLSQHAIVRHRSHKMPWALLKSSLKVFRHVMPKLDQTLDPEMDNSLSIVEHFTKDHRDIAFLLTEFDTLSCANPSDRIYSLYGLLQPLIRKELPAVNYALHYSSVYTQLAGYLTQPLSHTSGGLFSSILEFGSLFDVDELWPSWVPNWSQARTTQLHPSPRTANGSVPTAAQSSGGHRRMRHFGYVRKVLQRVPLLQTSSELWEYLNHLCNALKEEYDSSEASAARKVHVLLRILFADFYRTCNKNRELWTSMKSILEDWAAKHGDLEQQVDITKHPSERERQRNRHLGLMRLRRDQPSVLSSSSELDQMQPTTDEVMSEIMKYWNAKLQNSRFCMCSLEGYTRTTCMLGPGSVKKGDILATTQPTV